MKRIKQTTAARMVPAVAGCLDGPPRPPPAGLETHCVWRGLRQGFFARRVAEGLNAVFTSFFLERVYAMKSFQQLGRYCVFVLGVAAILGAAVVAQATPITFGGSYDGSYNPYSTTPPAGQSTWRQGTATLTPVPNNDNGTVTPGVAWFNDNSSTARLNMNRQYLDGNTFSSNQANDEYVYEARLKLYSAGAVTNTNPASTAVVAIGFRDEYNGVTSGKCVMLGWAPLDNQNNGVGLYFVTDAIGTAGSTILKITNTNYFDDQWHTYRVDKYISGSVAYVDVSVDNILLQHYTYSSMPVSTKTSEGFGWFGSTPNMANGTVDYIRYGTAVPEPGMLALLACGLIGLLAYAWRKRR
jgi:hypothetical protein